MGMGNKRVSKKKRLPTSGVIVGKVKWTPTARQWAKIRLSLGLDVAERRKIDAPLRAKIIEVVNRYFEREAFARDAPFVKDALAWLDGLQSASMATVSAYNSPRGPQPKKQRNPAKKKSADAIAKEAAQAAKDDARARKARSYMEAEIDDYLQDIGGGVNFRARDLVDILTKVSAATRMFANDLRDEDHPRFHEKSAWNSMVRSLWKLANEIGLPTSISNDRYPIVSPFVRLVSGVQSTFGDDAKAWHIDSVISLGHYILEATRDLRELKSENFNR